MRLIHWVNVHLQKLKEGVWFEDIHQSGITAIEKLLTDNLYKAEKIVILPEGFHCNKWFKLFVINENSVEYTVVVTAIFNDILTECSKGDSKAHIEYSIKSALNREVVQVIDLAENSISYKFV